MRILVTSDEPHAAHDAVVAELERRGHAVVRAGAVATRAEEPWVPGALDAARRVGRGEFDQGVFFCWSGTGTSLVANKVRGVRAALCGDAETARLAREWNDANVLCLANRTLTPELAKAALDAWFAAGPLPAAQGGVAGLGALDREVGLDGLRAEVRRSHDEHFGHTDRAERLRDLSHQVAELVHHRDAAHLAREVGDAGWSLLQLCTEAGIDLADAVRGAVARLDARRASGRKVALLGISANPMTNAHLTMGLEVLALTDVDEVWYLLPGEHPWGKKLLPAHHRLEMVRRAVARYPRLKVCDFEIAHAERIYASTRETAPMLRDFLFPAFPGYRFSWVMGSDAARELHRWGGHEWMVEVMDFVVVHRLGYEFDPAASVLSDPRHTYLRDNVVTSNISSTLVRERGRRHDAEQLVALVPEVVWQYLDEHHLLDPSAFG